MNKNHLRYLCLIALVCLTYGATAQAATSANYDLTQEGSGQNQYFATTSGYTIQAEIGAPTEAPTLSANFQYDHGASWFSSMGSAPVPIPTTPTGSPSAGGVPATAIYLLNQSSFQVIQINEHSILVSWISNQPSASRVVYGSSSVRSLVSGSQYGYPFTTGEENDQSTYHAIVIDGLQSGKLYYFRPVSRLNGGEVIGPELKMAPVFKSSQETLICPVPEAPIIKKPTPKPTPAIKKPTPAAGSTAPAAPIVPPVPTAFITNLKQNASKQYQLNGTAAPNAKLRIIVY